MAESGRCLFFGMVMGAAPRQKGSGGDDGDFVINSIADIETGDVCVGVVRVVVQCADGLVYG